MEAQHSAASLLSFMQRLYSKQVHERVHELAALLAAPIEGRKQADNSSGRARKALTLSSEWTSLEAAACADEKTHSQFLEDIALLPTLLGLAASLGTHQKPRFVELGAFDGSTLSNTFMLEYCFNWTGTLIEANPTNYAQLKRSYRASNKVHSAICADNGGLNSTVRMTAQGRSTTGQVDALTASQLKKYYDGKIPGVGKTIDVPCRSMSSILRSTGHPRAQFLSLDVEGAEALALSTMDPAAFDLILVEVQDHTDIERRRIDDLIVRGGGMRRARELWVPFSTVYVSSRVQEVPVSHRFVRNRRGKHSKTFSKTNSWQQLP